MSDIEYKFKVDLNNTDIQVIFITHTKEEYNNIKMLSHFLADGYVEIMRDNIHAVVNKQFKETDAYFR